MPLFIAHLDRGQPAARRVMLGPEIQGTVEGVFEEQYGALTRDILDETRLSGNTSQVRMSY